MFILTTDRIVNFGNKQNLLTACFGKKHKRIVRFHDIDVITYSKKSNEFICHVPKQFDYYMSSKNRNQFLSLFLILSDKFNTEGIWFYLVNEEHLGSYAR